MRESSSENSTQQTLAEKMAKESIHSMFGVDASVVDVEESGERTLVTLRFIGPVALNTPGPNITTEHTAVVTISSEKVFSAMIDGTWDAVTRPDNASTAVGTQAVNYVCGERNTSAFVVYTNRTIRVSAIIPQYCGNVSYRLRWAEEQYPPTLNVELDTGTITECPTMNCTILTGVTVRIPMNETFGNVKVFWQGAHIGGLPIGIGCDTTDSGACPHGYHCSPVSKNVGVCVIGKNSTPDDAERYIRFSMDSTARTNRAQDDSRR